MAITIQYIPANYSSVHGDLIYTVAEAVKTADPSTYPNYKFIGDVYIGATLVARLRKIPDPTTGIGIFNIGQVVRNYIATTFDPAPGVLVAQTLGNAAFNITVTMKFGEEYNYTSYYNLTLDSARIFFNNYNSRIHTGTSSLVSKTNKVASNKPAAADVLLSSNYFFVPYFPTTTGLITVNITPAGAGTPYTTSFNPANAYDLQLLNLAPGAINALAPGTINAATTRYTVTINGTAYIFNIVCEPIYQPYILHFLNQYGGFDSKMFTKVSRQTYEVTRADFGRLPFTVDGTGAVKYKNSHGVFNDNRSVYSSQFTEKLSINTDILSDDEYTWLRDLIISPMIYIEDGGYFFPCIIKDNNYEPKKYVNDDLTNLALNIEFGNQQNAQYR